MFPTPTTTAASISMPLTEALRRFGRRGERGAGEPVARAARCRAARSDDRRAIAAVGSANIAPKRRGSRKRSFRPEASRSTTCSCGSRAASPAATVKRPLMPRCTTSVEPPSTWTQQVLGAAADLEHAATGEQASQRARVDRLAQPPLAHLDRRRCVAEDGGLDGAAEDFDFGELGHRGKAQPSRASEPRVERTTDRSPARPLAPASSTAGEERDQIGERGVGVAALALEAQLGLEHARRKAVEDRRADAARRQVGAVQPVGMQIRERLEVPPTPRPGASAPGDP